MENFTELINGDNQQIDLPPGFRFHPTDEELITHYLSKKVLDCNFYAIAIGEVDLNRCEPWELPLKAKMGEKEWYFFCVRDRKYPTGLRTNRATGAGYWKATGKDKEIYRGKSLIGMKKTLVFYKGRAPKGEKTNWVMHEYRLDGKHSLYNLPKTAKNEWVICRIFRKSSGGKKIYVPGLVRLSSIGEELRPSLLPPLMDSSSHVTCFSNPVESQKNQEEMINCINSSLFSASVNPSDTTPVSSIFSKMTLPNSFYSLQSTQNIGNLQFPGSILMQDQTLLRGLLGSHESSMKQACKEEREMVRFSQETSLITDMNTEISSHELGRKFSKNQQHSTSAIGPVDLDSLWSF